MQPTGRVFTSGTLPDVGILSALESATPCSSLHITLGCRPDPSQLMQATLEKSIPSFVEEGIMHQDARKVRTKNPEKMGDPPFHPFFPGRKQNNLKSLSNHHVEGDFILASAS